MKMDLITVAMPVYNVENYVESALLSALNQTYENLEFIIVDDKGTDNSMKIVKKVIASHPRGKDVQIIEQPVNMGLGCARNIAIDNAKGKYLFFMDSDDEITQDCIQKLSDVMRKTNVNVVSGSYHKVDKNKIIDSNKPKDQIFRNKTDIILSYFNGDCPITIWNKLYTVSFLRKHNIRCMCMHRILEDTYYIFHVILCADSYCIISDVTYIYKYRKGSVSVSTNTGISNAILSARHYAFRDMASLLIKQQIDIDKKLRILIQKKFFWVRVHNAGHALNSPVELHHYINAFLNTSFLNDTCTLQSISLLLYFGLSSMPLFIKKLFLLLYLKIK